MTEKDGGSDVSGATRTTAWHPNPNSNECKLYGYKWFSSATDADMTLTLARFPKSQEELENGKGKIGLVFMRVRQPDSQLLNSIEVMRLKDKFGTRQLPTAELVLKGSNGLRISEPGLGIKYISNMLNITRLHNAVASCSFMQRMISLVLDYSSRR